MKTDNELIHIGKPIPFDTETFLGQLGELARASYNNDEISLKWSKDRSSISVL